MVLLEEQERVVNLYEATVSIYGHKRWCYCRNKERLVYLFEAAVSK